MPTRAIFAVAALALAPKAFGSASAPATPRNSCYELASPPRPAATIDRLTPSPSAHVPGTPWMTIGWRRTITTDRYIPVTPPAAKVVPISLVVEAGSEWETRSGALESLLGKASAIFARCGVTLGDAEVLKVTWKPEAIVLLNNPNPYAGPADMYVMDDPELRALARPIGFLFTPSIPSTAHAYNVRSVDIFTRQGFPARSLLNTFWMTSDQDFSRLTPDFAPTYSMAAHELAHIFGNLEHVDLAPNLMSNLGTRGAKSGDLVGGPVGGELGDQCVQIRLLYGSAPTTP